MATDGVAGPAAAPAADHAGRRILLAEDNAINQRVALAMLARLGYRADLVANGREVLVALGRAPYDLVLMDCQMPELDGYETSRAIRAATGAAFDPAIPIIALTANALSGDRARCLQAGMNDYLTKPIIATELAECLARHLHRTPVRAPTAVSTHVKSLVAHEGPRIPECSTSFARPCPPVSTHSL